MLMNNDIRELIIFGRGDMISIKSVVDKIENIAKVQLTRKYNFDAPKE